MPFGEGAKVGADSSAKANKASTREPPLDARTGAGRIPEWPKWLAGAPDVGGRFALIPLRFVNQEDRLAESPA